MLLLELCCWHMVWVHSRQCLGSLHFYFSRCSCTWARHPVEQHHHLLMTPILSGTRRGLIEGECVDADDFPPGTVFVSNDFSTAGSLSPIK